MAQFMPDFYGVFFWTGHAAMAAALGAVLVGVILWRYRDLSFEFAMPLYILGGLIAAPHTGNNDLVLAIPACLLAATRFPRLRLGLALLLSPVPIICVVIAPPSVGPVLIVGALLWFLLHAGANGLRDMAAA